MKDFPAKWSSEKEGHETANFGVRTEGQMSRSQEAEVKFGGPAETSVSTADYAVARCLFVRLSVSATHTTIPSKRLYTSSKYFHRRVAPPY